MSATQDRIQAFIDELVANGSEAGLQVAAWHRGELVVDAWSGLADVRTGRPVDGDTVFVTFSVSKGVTATIAHLLAERGQLDYDAPIADAWPEFAAHGKGVITARHALTHSAGLAHLPIDLQPRDLLDWDRMCAILGRLDTHLGARDQDRLPRVDLRLARRRVGPAPRRPADRADPGRGPRRALRSRLALVRGARGRRPAVGPPRIRAAGAAPEPAPDDYAALSVPPALAPLGALANGPELRTRSRAGGRRRGQCPLPGPTVRVAGRRRRRREATPLARARRDRDDDADRRRGRPRRGVVAEGDSAISWAHRPPSRPRSARPRSGTRAPAGSPRTAILRMTSRSPCAGRRWAGAWTPTATPRDGSSGSCTRCSCHERLDRSPVCGSSTARRSWPGRTARCSWPTLAQTSSRSSRPRAMRRAAGARPGWGRGRRNADGGLLPRDQPQQAEHPARPQAARWR